MAVLMASQTRSVFSASRMVLPGRISEAIAAEWVMPEQPMVSTSASSMTPFLTFRRQLAGALLRRAPAHTVGIARDVLDFLRLNPLSLFRDGRGAVVRALGDADHVFHFFGILHFGFPLILGKSVD